MCKEYGKITKVGKLVHSCYPPMRIFSKTLVYPELTWNTTIAPTGLTFMYSTKMAKQYENDMFVGDDLNGNLYHFKLNKDRTGLDLHGPLADTVVSNPNEMQGVILGQGFGRITDIKAEAVSCPNLVKIATRGMS